MNRKLYQFSKYFAVIVFCGFAMSWCLNLLYRWNNVPIYRHIVYLYHPMSKDSLETHFVTANLRIPAEDFSCFGHLETIIRPLYDDGIDIKISHRTKPDSIERPFYSNCDIPLIDFFDIYTIKVLNNKIYKDGFIDEIANSFVLLHFKSFESGQSQTNIQRINQNGHSVLLSKCDMISRCNWQLESDINRLHKSCQIIEEQELMDEKIFDFPVDSMYLKSFYLFLDRFTDSLNVLPSEKRYSRLDNLWHLITADNDISKAQYNLVVLSESVDSLNLCLVFNDIMKYYPIALTEHSGIKIEKGANYVQLNNIRSNHTDNQGTFRLFRMSKDDNNAYCIDGVYNNAVYNKVSFFALKYDMMRIQWIRLFVISSVLAYFVSLFFIYINKFLRLFKTIK